MRMHSATWHGLCPIVCRSTEVLHFGDVCLMLENWFQTFEVSFNCCCLPPLEFDGCGVVAVNTEYGFSVPSFDSGVSSLLDAILVYF